MGASIVRNDKQAEFIRLFTGSEWAGNATACAIRAGYSEPTARQTAYRLKRKFESQIKEEVVKRIGDNAALGLSGIIQIARNEKNPQIRLQACKDLLDRAGYSAISHLEINNMDNKSDEELKKELEKYIGGNVIDVTPTHEAATTKGDLEKV